MKRDQSVYLPRALWLGRVRFTPGFLFLAALLFYQSSSTFLISFLIAAALHEFSHIGMAALLHVSVRTLSMTAFGCVLSLADGALIPNGKLLLISAAGPLTNLGIAALCEAASDAVPVAALFGAENLLLALFNLLPVFPLDGAVMLSAALSSKLLPEQAERWVCGLSLVLVAVSVAAALLLHGSARPRVFLFSLWLAVGVVQKMEGRSCQLSFFQVK